MTPTLVHLLNVDEGVSRNDTGSGGTIGYTLSERTCPSGAEKSGYGKIQ